MDEIITNQPVEQPPATPTPEETGDSGKKLFTQEEVNRIVSERLARERAKGGPSPAQTREDQLNAREARLDCREYLDAQGYPRQLLELFDTADAGAFRAAVDRLGQLVDLPAARRGSVPRFTAGYGAGHGAPADRTGALLKQAFQPPRH